MKELTNLLLYSRNIQNYLIMFSCNHFHLMSTSPSLHDENFIKRKFSYTADVTVSSFEVTHLDQLDQHPSSSSS